MWFQQSQVLLCTSHFSCRTRNTSKIWEKHELTCIVIPPYFEYFQIHNPHGIQLIWRNSWKIFAVGHISHATVPPFLVITDIECWSSFWIYITFECTLGCCYLVTSKINIQPIICKPNTGYRLLAKPFLSSTKKLIMSKHKTSLLSHWQ